MENYILYYTTVIILTGMCLYLAVSNYYYADLYRNIKDYLEKLDR